MIGRRGPPIEENSGPLKGGYVYGRRSALQRAVSLSHFCTRRATSIQSLWGCSMPLPTETSTAGLIRRKGGCGNSSHSHGGTSHKVFSSVRGSGKSVGWVKVSKSMVSPRIATSQHRMGSQIKVNSSPLKGWRVGDGTGGHVYGSRSVFTTCFFSESFLNPPCSPHPNPPSPNTLPWGFVVFEIQTLEEGAKGYHVSGVPLALSPTVRQVYHGSHTLLS